MILKDVPKCAPYMDDVLVSGSTFEELMSNVRNAIRRFGEVGITISGAKTEIGLRSVEFLGSLITEEGRKPLNKHIEAIEKWRDTRPVRPAHMQAFIGLVNYLNTYIENYSLKVRRLTPWMAKPKNTNIVWSEEMIKDYNSLIDELVSPNLVYHPDFSEGAEEFFIRTDSCVPCAGAILYQNQTHDGVNKPRVIAYASRMFTKEERKWANIIRETYAVYWSITKAFRYYIYGGKSFSVYTDHKPCLVICGANKVVNLKMYKWALELQQYPFKLFYCKGEDLGDADGISRMGYINYDKMLEDGIPDYEEWNRNKGMDLSMIETHMGINSVEAIYDDEMKEIGIVYNFPEEWRKSWEGYGISNSIIQDEKVIHVNAIQAAGYQPQAIKQCQQEDKLTGDIIKSLKGVKLSSRARNNKIKKWSWKCCLEDDILYYKGGWFGKRLFVPTTLIPEIVKSYHDASWAAHLGGAKILANLRLKYYWPDMHEFVQDYIKSCEKCQSRNEDRKKRNRVPFHTFLEGHRIFSRWSVDTLGPYKKTKRGNKFIIMFMCLDSRWCEGFCTPDNTAPTAAKLFVEQIAMRYGPPNSLLSDQGGNYLSPLVKEIMKLLGTEHLTTGAYHPNTNSLQERSHRVYNNIFSKYISKERDFDEIFPYAQHAARTSVHSDLGVSPYFLTFGQIPVNVVDITLFPEIDKKPKRHIKSRAQILKGLKATRKITNELNHELQFERMKGKEHVDKLPGEKVLIRIHTKVIGEDLVLKWQPQWSTDVYEIVEQLSPTMYKVKNTKKRNDIRDLDIVDIKTYYVRENKVVSSPTLELDFEGEDHGFNDVDEDEIEIERIVGKWTHQQRGRQSEVLYRVRFAGLDQNSDLWMKKEQLSAGELIREYEQDLVARGLKEETYVDDAE
eukprot:Awhi_evm2s14209